MVIKRLNKNDYHLVFDKDELEYLEREARENGLTIEQMINELFVMVFSGGYEFIC